MRCAGPITCSWCPDDRGTDSFEITTVHSTTYPRDKAAWNLQLQRLLQGVNQEQAQKAVPRQCLFRFECSLSLCLCLAQNQALLVACCNAMRLESSRSRRDGRTLVPWRASLLLAGESEERRPSEIGLDWALSCRTDARQGAVGGPADGCPMALLCRLCSPTTGTVANTSSVGEWTVDR